MSDETSIQKPETVLEPAAHTDDEVLQPAAADEKKTPKRTPKRRSFIERAQRESEELVRNMGGSLELEGGRRTRSSTRGTPTHAAETVTPPPSKKARTSPSVNKSGGRARGARKLDVGSDEPEQEAAQAKPAEEEQVSEPAKANAAKTNADKPVKVADQKEDNETKAKTTDEPDAVHELAPLPEDKQNNVDHGKTNKADAVLEKKEADELPKSEEAPKNNDTDAAAAMDVDSEQPAAAAEQPTTDSAPSAIEAVVEVVEKKSDAKENNAAEEAKATVEPSKEPTPEPMEVDASSKESSDAASAIPADETAPVPAATETAVEPAKSNNAVDEVSTEVKENTAVAVEANSSAADTNSAPAENNTPSVAATAAASNDVSKPAPVAAAEPGPPVVVESAVKEPLPNSDLNKSEQNDNGEPKIVNNASEDADNHATPQVCN